MCTLHCAFLHVLAPTRNAHSVLTNKDFCIGDQSESLSRVRCWLGVQYAADNSKNMGFCGSKNGFVPVVAPFLGDGVRSIMPAALECHPF